MAGPTGRPRGRPPKATRVAEVKQIALSPVRRNTRLQHQQYQVAIPEGQELIDPNLENSPTPQYNLGKIAQRGLRRTRHSSVSMAPSLAAGSQTQASSDIEIPDPEFSNFGALAHQEMLGGDDRFRGPSSSLSEAKAIPVWKQRKAPQQLSLLWEQTKNFYDHVSNYKFPLTGLPTDLSPDQRGELEEWEDERSFELDKLETNCRFFLKNDHDMVIHPRHVLDFMGRSAGSPDGEQAFKKICATNFAILLDEILTIQRKEPLPFLQSWDRWFPQVFYGGLEDCGDQTEQILQMVMDIRTQLLIFTLQKLEASDVDAKIREVAKIFCTELTPPLRDLIRRYIQDPDNQGIVMETKRISFINLDGAGNGEWYKRHYTQRVCALVTSLEDPDSPLEEDYPFGPFLDNFRQFAQTNFERLKGEVEGDRGRPWSTHENVESQQLQLQLESETRGHGYESLEPRSSNSEAYMRGQDDITRLQSQDIISRAQVIQSSVHHGSVIYSPAGGYEHVGSQQSGEIYAESAAQVAGMKRTAPNAPELEQTAAPKKTRTRRRKPDTTTQPPVTPASGALVPVPSQQYTPPDIEALSQRAKERSAANRKTKEPQVRTQWSRHDTLLLISAVDGYKCKWSAMERAIKEGTIPFEHPRDQQALRDKARLLKQDMLKADAILPPSFDLVVLGKKERNAVIQCGKNPDRREADKIVDPSGKEIAVNTEFVEGTQGNDDDQR